MTSSIAFLNCTNAIPKRILLISSEFSTFNTVKHICWQKFDSGNAPSDAQLIKAASCFAFLFKLSIALIIGRYKAYVFDDMRILPIAVILGKLKGVKLIYNRQEVPSLTAAQMLHKMFRLPKKHSIAIAEAVESFFGRKVNLVISIPLKKSVEYRLINWGCPLVSISNVPEKLHAALPNLTMPLTNDKRMLLIYSGAVSLENGLLSYLRLVRRLDKDSNTPPVSLLLIGRLWKLSFEDLRLLINEECCAGLVEYREWVPYETLIELLASADIGLAMTDPEFEKYTYMGEGSSRKIFTYMSAGLPIITGGAFGKVILDEQAGYFVDYNDIDAMYKAAQRIFLSQEDSELMSLRGKSAILNKYNWEIEGRKLRVMLQEIIS